jgi:predicted adenine nucleotide alpha hydrolase (AANH) superfamily ATPase
LRQEGFEITGFFYNPNIHPFLEYKNRKQAVADFSKSAGLEVVYPQYAPAEFFRAVNLKRATPERCLICWSLRLKRTAQAAKEKGISVFSTTLLVSPYQDQGSVNKIGSDISQEEGINFYSEDFRPGFRKAHDLARAQGLYCQKYCGCVYSQMERFKKELRTKD